MHLRTVRALRTPVVVEDMALRRSLKVVELASPDGAQDEQDQYTCEEQCRRDCDQEKAHARSVPGAGALECQPRSLSEFAVTARDDRPIAIAAESGCRKPVAASGTATTL